MAQFGLHHFSMKHVDVLVWQALTCGSKYRHAALYIHKFTIFLDSLLIGASFYVPTVSDDSFSSIKNF